MKWKPMRQPVYVVLCLMSMLGMPLSAQTRDTTTAVADATREAQNAGDWVRARESAAATLKHTITLELHSSTIADALTALGRASGLKVMFGPDVTHAAGHVSVHADGLSVAEALAVVLQGTGLEAYVSLHGDELLVRRKDPSRSDLVHQQGGGTVSGYVRDSATGVAIARADVRVDGTSLSTKSTADGAYEILDIPAGDYRVTVRRVGYLSHTSTVTVVDRGTVKVNFLLNQPRTTLDEVVTTAVGDQRRYQVGNVISTINVDSVVPTTPVTSVTDLLSGRAPGVQVMENSGLLGAGEAIRIRGVASLALQSDPIIIVDGVRQDNAPGGYLAGTGGALNFSHQTPSRINDLNFDDIATIDILKGPAASTEYGTDAADGVIVITTKHGTAGSPSWHADAQDLSDGVPAKYPQHYYSWGHLVDGSQRSVNCVLAGVDYSLGASTSGGCITDSISSFYPLNNRQTTLFTSGGGQRYDLSVDGGSESIRYFVAGGMSAATGVLQMPPALRQLADTAGVILPAAALRSNSEQQQSIRLNTAIKLNAVTDLNMTANFLSTNTVTPAAGALFFGLGWSPAIDNAKNLYGYNALYMFNYTYSSDSPLALLSNIGTDNTTRLTGGATANWSPTGWLVAHATAGIDHGLDQQQAITYPAGSNSANLGTYGSLNRGTLTTDVYTLDLRASATAQVTKGLQGVTSVGLQLAETKSGGVVGNVNDITLANLTLDGYPNPTVSQSTNEVATLGGYGEEQLNIADRLFLIGAVRIDGASGFGNDYAVAAYPKGSFSWLVIKTAQTSIRLRGAFGESGQQPENGASQVLFTGSTVFLTGVTPSETIEWPGNPTLRPERSEEYEGGFDVAGWGNRLSLQVTAYQKTTHDALLAIPMGGDLCCFTEQENLGEIQNSGLEATATIGIVESPSIDWEVTLNGSINHNKLVSIAPSAILPNYGGDGTHNQVGYPLYGLWGTPVSYLDRNRDGIIEADEIQTADSSKYEGPSEPTQTLAVSSHFGFWHDQVTVGALLDYQGGYRVYNNIASLSDYFGSSAAANLPTAPLWQQAGTVAYKVAPGASGPGAYFENGDMLRFREISATYGLPRKLARGFHVVQYASVTVGVRNLALWTRYTGVDPETSNGGFYYGGNVQATPAGTQEINNDIRADNGSVPLLRSWMVRLNLGLK